jgi:hypothetical protein
LQRNATISQRAADLNDDAAIARLHAPQRRKRAVNGAEISDIGDTFVLFRLHFFDRRKDRNHRVVYPDVDWPETLFDRDGRGFHGGGIGHIARQHERFASERLDVPRRAFEAIHATRD